MTSTPDTIVSFWQDAGREMWFRKSDAFDDEIRERFHDDVIAARDGALDGWIDEPTSCLALLLLLDQFPRNIFRGTPDMFASDPKAVSVTRRAIELGHDQVAGPAMRPFIYMPFMHSEASEDQALSVALYTKLGAPDNLKAAVEHAEIIEKFGRFPHRNDVLNRSSTEAELEFLANGGFAG